MDAEHTVLGAPLRHLCGAPFYRANTVIGRVDVFWLGSPLAMWRVRWYPKKVPTACGFVVLEHECPKVSRAKWLDHVVSETDRILTEVGYLFGSIPVHHLLRPDPDAAEALS